MLLHYGETLRFGNKFIYQSMPRLLSLWLDFGAEMSDPVPSSGKLASSERASSKKTLDNLNATVSKLTKELPPYQFLMAYSQLVSRICHPNSIVFSLIKVSGMLLPKSWSTRGEAVGLYNYLFIYFEM